MSLTTAQLAEFETNGYLVLKDVLPPATVAALLAETHRLLAEFSLDGHPLTRFTTAASARNKKKKSPTTTAAADEDDNDDDDNDDVEHVGDDYFLTSGDKIRFFFEEDAFDPSSSRLTKPKERAINKIGHCLHALSPPFRALLSPAHAYGGVASEHAPPALARALGFADPRCLQSMVICKQPEIGGAVPPHQDSTFLYTDPPSAVGFWYALEDATLENGCLSFLPGSHKVSCGGGGDDGVYHIILMSEP
jgi:phytanoyl-CoA hydroxylase